MKWTVRPLSDVTGFGSGRTESQFTTSWSSAVTLLERELDQLRAADVVLELDLREGEIRLDGMPKANAKARSNRVRLAFASKHGDLVYATDQFERSPWGRSRYKMTEDWQHNVYAIAKALEALRLIDRYGVTTGAQYTGFKALGAGATALGAPTMTRREAAELLERVAIGEEGGSRDRAVQRILDDLDNAREVHRYARAASHPDRRGGDHSVWHQVEEAAKVLGVTRG